MGEWEIFTRNGRKPGAGGGGDGKCLKSLYIVSREVLTHLFYEDPLSCLSPFFQMLSTPSPSPPKFSVTSNTHLHYFSVVIYL